MPSHIKGRERTGLSFWALFLAVMLVVLSIPAMALEPEEEVLPEALVMESSEEDAPTETETDEDPGEEPGGNILTRPEPEDFDFPEIMDDDPEVLTADTVNGPKRAKARAGHTGTGSWSGDEVHYYWPIPRRFVYPDGTALSQAELEALGDLYVPFFFRGDEGSEGDAPFSYHGTYPSDPEHGKIYELLPGKVYSIEVKGVVPGYTWWSVDQVIVKDIRTMRFNIQTDKNCRVTVSDVRFTDDAGNIVGNQNSFEVVVAPVKETAMDVPRTIVGNYDGTGEDTGAFLVVGDESVLMGENNYKFNGNTWNSRWFSCRLDSDDQAPLYVREGIPYEIEIRDDPKDTYSKNGILSDGRVMRQTVFLDRSGKLSVSNRRFTLGDGTVVGDQTSFAIRDKNPWMPWTEAEKAKADDIMFDMTLEEKIGQVFLAVLPPDADAALVSDWTRRYHLGGFMVSAPLFAGSNPQAVKDMTSAGQAAADIPLLFAVDEEGGKVTQISQYGAFSQKTFPAPKTVAAGGASAAEADGKAKAELLGSLGFNVNLGVTADTAVAGSPIHDRTYGGTGLYNSAFVAASVRGHEAGGVAPVLRHFPGYGDGSGRNDGTINDFYYDDLLPFYAGLSAGGDALFLGHTYADVFGTNGRDVRLSSRVIDYLEARMRFYGITIADEVTPELASSHHYADGEVFYGMIHNGIDLIITSDPESSYACLLRDAKEHPVHLDGAVQDILCWKIRMGLISEEINLPEDGEAEFVDGDTGKVYRRGAFADMWDVHTRHSDGYVRLLKDCETDTVPLEANMGAWRWFCLCLNGHRLTVMENNGITVPKGVYLTVLDSSEAVWEQLFWSDVYTGKTWCWTPSGNMQYPEVSVSFGNLGWDAESRVLGWSESDPFTGSRVQKAADFSKVGSISGPNAENLMVIEDDGHFSMWGGYLTSGGRGLLVKAGGDAFLDFYAGTGILGCGHENVPENGGGVCVEPDGVFGAISFSLYRATPESSRYVFIGGNKAAGDGGGIWNGASKFNGNMDLHFGSGEFTIVSNETGGSGGGLYNGKAGIRVYLGNSVICGNSAGKDGGGAFMANGSILDSDGFGGICVRDNSAGGKGGGVYLSENAVFKGYDGTVSGNSAKNGGGLYVSRGAEIAECKAMNGKDYLDITVTFNRAEDGGGLYYEGVPELVFKRTAIHNNEASGKGGGVYVGEAPSVRFENFDLSRNKAADGGGIYMSGTKEIYLKSSAIDRNTADTNAGLYWPPGAVLTMEGQIILDGNVHPDGSFDNFIIPAGQSIHIVGGTLQGGSAIRFSTEDRPTADGHRVPIATGERFSTINSRHAFVLGDDISEYLILAHDTEGELDLVDASSIPQSVAVRDILFQWYAPARTLSETGDKTRALKLIDTSARPEGSKLLSNGEMNPILKYIFLNPDGTVLYDEMLTPIFRSEDLPPENLPYINTLWKFQRRDRSYLRYQIWIREDGEKGLSLDPSDWTIYDWHEGMRLVTDPAQAGPEDIFVGRGSVVRFVGAPKTGEIDFDAILHDYDISDGTVTNKSTGHAMSPEELAVARSKFDPPQWNDAGVYHVKSNTGINDAVNFPSESTAKNRYGFGNGNTGAPYQNAIHGDTDMFMNKFNRKSFEGCNYGLISGLDADKLPVASDGVYMPKLFTKNAETAKTERVFGRTSYPGQAARFALRGNSLVLSEIPGTGATGLDRFSHPGIYDGVQNKTLIWTNNFWPMDGFVTDGDGHDPVFGKFRQASPKSKTLFTIHGTTGSYNRFPESDDALDHNSYFGLQFIVDFELSSDYIGPMQYIFFGDDDMWVFLDDTQIVDVGGVHRAVGTYVDFWDYLDPAKDAGKHTLRFFFTERGASGSVCFMNMYLPNVRNSEPEPDYPGSLRIEKTVSGAGADPDREFEFTVTLDTSEAESQVSGDVFGYKGSKTGTIRSGDTIKLRHGEYVIIEGIPAGTKYRVEEAFVFGYTPVWSQEPAGEAGADPLVLTVENRYGLPSALPETGGKGILGLTAFGVCLGLTGVFLRACRRKEKI